MNIRYNFCMKTAANNTKEVWDKVWSDPGLVKEDILILENERNTIRWQRIKKVLKLHLKSIRGRTVLEIGSGIGTYAALLASEGAQVSLLDYSDKALERAQEFFRVNKLKAVFIKDDALNISNKKIKKYDISISVGLTEHFKGRKRFEISKVHVDVLKKGGIGIIIVPNKYNPPYRIFKFASELLGTWKYGEEYPYSRSELSHMCDQMGVKCIGLFGDDLYQSIKFLLPANFLRRIFRVGSPRTIKEIRRERGTSLDDYFSYSLVLMVKK